MFCLLILDEIILIVTQLSKLAHYANFYCFNYLYEPKIFIPSYLMYFSSQLVTYCGCQVITKARNKRAMVSQNVLCHTNVLYSPAISEYTTDIFFTYICASFCRHSTCIRKLWKALQSALKHFIGLPESGQKCLKHIKGA